MPLLKTTVISSDDNALALEQYNALIQSDKIIMVVLGNSETIIEGVELADELADTSPTDENRWLMWVKNHIMLKDKLEPILKESEIVRQGMSYEEVKVFCLTRPERKVLSRVHKNGQMDFARLEFLFIEAEEASIS